MNDDPDFIRFILAWVGLDPKYPRTIVPFTNEMVSEAEQKRKKRKLQREFGESWKPRWKEEQAINKEWSRLTLRKDLFKLEPSGPKPNHRPRNPKWHAYFLLYEYFKQLGYRNYLQKAGKELFPKWFYYRMNSEWHKRKKWFEKHDGDPHWFVGNPYYTVNSEANPYSGIEFLWQLYQVQNVKIKEALKTGTPLYDRAEHSLRAG